ncbi:hypothetical protein VNO77_32128 [Canavalia gladiata]|uniref:Uncharacterized protein n=1 Tax=Canavalia gladiata TaxID=3824 RepID=A0AAN9KPT7_CANGL
MVAKREGFNVGLLGIIPTKGGHQTGWGRKMLTFRKSTLIEMQSDLAHVCRRFNRVQVHVIFDFFKWLMLIQGEEVDDVLVELVIFDFHSCNDGERQYSTQYGFAEEK